MMKGELRDQYRVRDSNWQKFDMVTQELGVQKQLERFADRKLAKAHLDRHFPYARHAEENGVSPIGDDVAHLDGQTHTTRSKPQECMCIEE